MQAQRLFGVAVKPRRYYTNIDTIALVIALNIWHNNDLLWWARYPIGMGLLVLALWVSRRLAGPMPKN